jgi:hypothetical protein
MATVEQPITRSELREELGRILLHYATRADLHAGLSELETRLTRWMIGLLIGSTVAASAIAMLIQTLIY